MIDHARWARMLAALSSGEPGWIRPADLADRAGLDPEAALDVLAELDGAGWIQCDPERDGGPVVCLSPLGAAVLGLDLADRGDGLMWAPAGTYRRPRLAPDPGTVHASALSAAGDDDAPAFDAPDDRQPDPADLAAAAEESERARARYRADPYPKIRPPMELKPTLILGLRPQWGDARGLADGEACPGCGGLPLPPHAACVYPGCDRWGSAERTHHRARRRA
jgi:hypothetical protein